MLGTKGTHPVSIEAPSLASATGCFDKIEPCDLKYFLDGHQQFFAQTGYVLLTNEFNDD